MVLAYTVIDGYRTKRYPSFPPVVEASVLSLATISIGDVHQVIEVFYIDQQPGWPGGGRRAQNLTQEVADHKRAETSLLLRERALAVATTPIVTVDAQAQGRPIVYVDAAFEQLTGYSTGELIGQTLRLLIGPETDLDTVARLAQAVHEGRAEGGELGSYRKDGQLIWLEVAGAPVRAADGSLTHCVWVYTDVTQRKEAEGQARARSRADGPGRRARSVDGCDSGRSRRWTDGQAAAGLCAGAERWRDATSRSDRARRVTWSN